MNDLHGLVLGHLEATVGIKPISAFGGFRLATSQ